MNIFQKIITATALTVLLLPQITYAYSYSGHKWFRFPGTIRIVDIEPAARNRKEELAIRAAMSSWTNAGAKFYFIDDTESGSGNDFGYYYKNNTSVLAYNHIDINVFGYITRSYIRVNTYFPWATNGDKNKFDFQSMAAHELGHSLKLLHSSKSEATMFYSISKGETKKRSLHTDDKDGIKYIYGEE